MRALLFDLDGTLIDSLEGLAISVNYALRQFGLPLRSVREVRQAIGQGNWRLMELSAGLTDRRKVEQLLTIFHQHYKRNCLVHTRLYPGMQQLLSRLCRNWLLGVISNKNEEFCLTILEHLKALRYFKKVIGGDTLKQKKPHPAPLLYFARRYNISPQKIVLIGDHATDMEAGRRARIKTIFCRYGIGRLNFSLPDAIIDQPAQLPPLLSASKDHRERLPGVKPPAAFYSRYGHPHPESCFP